MVATTTAVSALFMSWALLAQADVTPNEPGPGEAFNQGTTCKTSWDGDTASPTAWANMSIELMTGSNTDMVHLTTIATNQDGTQAGTFTFPCPAVTPNSNIYFYQYSAPGTKVLTWTTRFIIASDTGTTVKPENDVEPDGKPVPWGVGALSDPSSATPPPAYLADSGAGAAAGAANSTIASGVPSGVPSASSTPPSVPSSGSVAGNTTAPSLPSASDSTAPSKGSTAPSTRPSGAAASVKGDAATFGGIVAASIAFLTLL